MSQLSTPEAEPKCLKLTALSVGKFRAWPLMLVTACSAKTTLVIDRPPVSDGYSETVASTCVSWPSLTNHLIIVVPILPSLLLSSIKTSASVASGSAYALMSDAFSDTNLAVSVFNAARVASGNVVGGLISGKMGSVLASATVSVGAEFLVFASLQLIRLRAAMVLAAMRRLRWFGREEELFGDFISLNYTI
ncbi:MAG: hypothetical protein JWO47_97 [Candidatus Saccharibacteria bacterium]|nr:hypothetical protein [Candidatus Saccharibacteria bacterium]